MNWIIQDNLYSEEGFFSLLRALEALKLPHSVHRVVPFSHELIPDPTPTGKTIVMGAYTMINIAKTRGWLPGAFSNENFDFPLQKENWGELLLNHDAWIGPFGEVPPQKELFFIRPTLDSKFFPGRIMDWGEFEEWKEKIFALAWEGTVTPDTQVMVNRVRKIYREFRTWIVNSEVVTASLYKEGNQVRYDSQVDEEIILFAQACAKAWEPAKAYVLDVAETPDGLFILEINCLNAAGFYKGNVGRIVQALEDLESPRSIEGELTRPSSK